MTQESLRELLTRVHEQLSTSGSSLDQESERMLGTLMHDIERALGGGSPEPEAAAQHTPRLESLAVRFEAGHPALAETLRELIDALVKAGI
jgi:hypothetical protein